MTPQFTPFPKIARLSRQIIITEKIDGTNAQVYVPGPLDPDYGSVYAGSRTRWITPESDNFGFAAWVKAHEDELRELGPGKHFGEWWGAGIQRRYGLTEKRFSLFNVHRWKDARPACCDVVPLLYDGPFSQAAIDDAIENLARYGSLAAPGFMKPEGVVVFHAAASIMFKKTLEKDEQPKGQVAA
jgi:hypothetical protein